MSDPVLHQVGDLLFVHWGSDRTIQFARLIEHKDSLSAELTVVEQGKELHWARINLLATLSRNSLSKELDKLLPNVGWQLVVERSCRMVTQHIRTPEPTQELDPAEPREERWLVPPYIPRDETTVIYGDGGTGKSLLVLAFAVSGLLGYGLGGPWTVASINRVLYLDWESEAATHAERLYGLTHRRELVPKGSIRHRRLWRPLTEQMDVVRKDAAEHHADLIICDSLGAAGGAEPESSDAAIRTLMALRSLPGTKLALAHVSKASADLARSRPFGSVYVQNLARSTIEVRRAEPLSDDDAALVMSLYHRKTNVGQLGKPSALTF